VARAVHFATRLVILDEPTAALGVRETRNVLRMVKRLPEHGISVILISHNLDQVAEVADRVVVMRRGRKVGEARPDPASHDEIIRMIVGG
jgi:D-xylose transport system ATP-binding protein